MNKNDVINKIAREILDLETLETRRMDGLDFKEQAVWSIAEALSAAYDAGRKEKLAANKAAGKGN